MKQYVIDELRPNDHQRIKRFLEEKYGASQLNGIYWLPLDPGLYSGTQSAHTECQPYYFALDLGPTRLSCELLVRTKSRMRCPCMGYASVAQRNYLIDTVDTCFDALDIKI
jgi:hypothetical protein